MRCALTSLTLIVVVEVLLLVVAGVPAVLLAVLAGFNDEDGLFAGGRVVCLLA
jgi:hypothetical protein